MPRYSPSTTVILQLPPEELARLEALLGPAPVIKNPCKRCLSRWPGIAREATRIVRTWLGLEIVQCEECAALTAKEAKEDWSGGD